MTTCTTSSMRALSLFAFLFALLLLEIVSSLLLESHVLDQRLDFLSSPLSLPNVLVGAYYYPWYGHDFHAGGGGYLREKLVPRQTPTLGKYDDRKNETIRQHLIWSHQANIGLWVISWEGPMARGDNTTLHNILNHENLSDMKIALFYETKLRTEEFRSGSNIVSDIMYISRNYFNHPNYLRVNGRPVLVIYLSRTLSKKKLLKSFTQKIRKVALQLGHKIYLIGDDDPATSSKSLNYLDAVTRYNVYGGVGRKTQAGYAGQEKVDAYYNGQALWRENARSVGVGFVPAVTPGFNDRGVRTGNSPLSRKLNSTAEFGSLFRAMLERAIPLVDASVQNMLLVTSWNEWHEDTQIEPVSLAKSTNANRSDPFTAGLQYEGYETLYLDLLYNLTATAKEIEKTSRRYLDSADATMFHTKQYFESLPSAAGSLSQENRGEGPGIVWLMSFPNSGTSYTLKAVQKASSISVATNYGEETIDKRIRSIDGGITGPFWWCCRDKEDMECPHECPTDGNVLTKTHCGGYSLDSQWAISKQKFIRRCLTYSGGKGNSARGEYRLERVKKVVHLIRDPFDNIVSRFHNDYENSMATNEMHRYERSSTGFRDYCRDRVDVITLKGIKDSPALDLLREVPCHTDFLRYLTWHDLAFHLVAERNLPYLSLYYESYGTSWNATLLELIRFLGRTCDNGPEKHAHFETGKSYRAYFSPEEVTRVHSALEKLASETTWASIRRYFP